MKWHFDLGKKKCRKQQMAHVMHRMAMAPLPVSESHIAQMKSS